MDATTYSALGQPGVGFFMAIIIGALAGWLAEKFTRSDMGLFANIIMGIIGAVVGNFLARLLGIYVVGFWGNLISDRRRHPRHRRLSGRRRASNELLAAPSMPPRRLHRGAAGLKSPLPRVLQRRGRGF